MKNIDQDKVDQFLNSVLDRYHTLIQLGIYPITMAKIEAWVNNFSKPEHRYIAAQILDRLIYRSHKMVKESYQSFLVSILRDFYFDSIKEKPEPISEWLYQLRQQKSRYADKLVIAPVRLIDDSGASGDTICRTVGVHSSFTKQLTVDGFEGRRNKSELPNGKVILLVDDMLGSGDQICKFAEAVNLQAWSGKNHLIYAPLIALEKGLQIAQTNLPFLKISPIEVLEQDQHFFSFEEDARFLGNDDIKESDAIDWYKQMLHANGISPKKSLGRDKTALTLAFEWGCPNQTLLALWCAPSSKNRGWSSLFNRRE